MPDHHFADHRHQRQRPAMDLSGVLMGLWDEIRVSPIIQLSDNPIIRFLLVTAVALLFISCNSQPVTTAQTPTRQSTNTPTPTSQPTHTPTLTATATPQPTATATATATPAVVPTSTPSPTPTATPIATAVPPEKMINGLYIDEFIWVDTAVRANIRAISQRARAQNRNPNAFSKIGDSVALSPHYLTRFDDPKQYNLGIYDYLQPTIDHFAGSFLRYGIVSHVSLSARTLYELGWADEDLCQPNENAVECEIRLHQPSVMLIRLGTNDQVINLYDQNMRQLIEMLIESGIIPVLITKADRFEGEDNRNNQHLRDLAVEYAIPLIDFDRLADTLPQRGLSGDHVHMTMNGDNDYTQEISFERGYPVNDLAILMTLEIILDTVQGSVDSN